MKPMELGSEFWSSLSHVRFPHLVTALGAGPPHYKLRWSFGHIEMGQAHRQWRKNLHPGGRVGVLISCRRSPGCVWAPGAPTCSVCAEDTKVSCWAPVSIYVCWRVGSDLATEQQCQQSSAAQSCLTLCDPMNCSFPGSSVHGISQARILEWVAISFSRESGLPFPSLGDLSDPGIESTSPALAGRFFFFFLTTEPPGKPMSIYNYPQNLFSCQRK